MKQYKIIHLLTNSIINHCLHNCIYINDLYITYKELFDKIIIFKNQLKSLKIKKGTIIGLYLENSIEYIISFFTINFINCTIVPIYTRIGEVKLKRLINSYNISQIITSKKLKIPLDIILKECPRLQNIIVYDNFKMDFHKNIYFNNNDKIKKLKHVALILLTSGTTNFPKAIMLTNKNIISNVISISDYLKLKSIDNVVIFKNLTHSSSITGELLTSIFNGCNIYLYNKLLLPVNILKFLSAKKITVFFVIPNILKEITKSEFIESNYIKFFLRIIHFYGEKIDSITLKKLIEIFPRSNLIYSYGLSEASPRVTYIEKNELLKYPESCGKPVKNVKVFVCNDKKKRINEANKVGEIVVKGPNIMMGYYKNKILTKKILFNKLLFTRDLGYLDINGLLYFKGRKDNLIIQYGKNIYPEEIEKVIMLYKNIKQVLVRNEMNKKLNMFFLTAYIVLSGKNFNSKNLLQFCKKNLEDYKVPKKILIIQNLKKTYTGKIKRNQVINQ